MWCIYNELSKTLTGVEALCVPILTFRHGNIEDVTAHTVDQQNEMNY